MKQGCTIWVLAAFGWVCASAGEPGDSVVVVYNSRMSESKKVAEHYAERRGVPKDQVIGFRLPTAEVMSREEFQDDLQERLFDRLVKEKLFTFNSAKRPNPVPPDFRPLLDAKVRYLVLCYGVPLKISPDPLFREPFVERLPKELQRNGAAVDNELALLPLSRERIMVTGPSGNPFYGTTNQNHFQPTNGILLVSRLDGPSFEIANGLVDKAIKAETDGLWGRAYFDIRNIGNTNYRLGDDWIRSASEVARRLGFETVLDEAPTTFAAEFPMSHIGLYAGWYDVHVSGPFGRPEVEFMPGAFAYHLHSFSAATLRSTSMHWVGPLLAKGATISMGCVDEPYLSGTPNVAVFLERLIYNRFTFGEAAYAAQSSLSWQTTVVGDPLYRPFAERPDVLHRRLEREKKPELEWSHLRVVNLNIAGKFGPPEEMLKYLDEIATTRESAVLTEKRGDILRQQKRLSAAAEAYAAALKLQPSPQQKIRLLLTIGELQSLLAREQQAYDAYSQIISDVPEFPNLVQIYQRLIPLAERLKKTNEVERFKAEIARLSEAK